MTAEQFVTRLDPPIGTRYLINCNTLPKRMRTYNFSGEFEICIENDFVWDNSPEGYDYWRKVFLKGFLEGRITR